MALAVLLDLGLQDVNGLLHVGHHSACPLLNNTGLSSQIYFCLANGYVGILALPLRVKCGLQL